ncbi:YsnF/AvaK domain-containing protein [Clostridium lacusfryxellense]|uniref:YsnF/AvaK domain-containing protein n=1 Tax=Clostridium lacusfryxellense TaxID=205328 RepID=UPI001C0DB66C|nr:YsnF/AvaK domain-containing protein [Clostridium lacusfryxellense]MBU3110769.1 YsnF/AvaK domain-containing protein [Clostridium lacusfryxellense]
MKDECKATFQIKKEELDIAKEWMQTSEVNICRQTITEDRSFIVPVKREELVITKKNLASATTEHDDMPPEIIRIILNEEHVEFNKHTVKLEDVSIYKQQLQDIKHIEEILKREVPIVKISNALDYRHN